jgi:hypothetical protein
MGGQMWWPSRNLMNDAVNDELDKAFPELTKVAPSLFFPGEKRRATKPADPMLPQPRKQETEAPAAASAEPVAVPVAVPEAAPEASPAADPKR